LQYLKFAKSIAVTNIRFCS